MTDVIEHQGFIATVHYSSSDECFFGKLEGVQDLVTFEGTTVRELKRNFMEAVKDYVALCQQQGKDPMKSFKGSFNVRIPPSLHMEIFRQATLEGKNLNEFVQQALTRALHPD